MHEFEGLDGKSTDEKIIALFNTYNIIAENAFNKLANNKADIGYIGEYHDLLQQNANLSINDLQKKLEGEKNPSLTTPGYFIADALKKGIINKTTAEELLELDKKIFPENHVLNAYISVKDELHNDDKNKFEKFLSAIMQELNSDNITTPIRNACSNTETFESILKKMEETLEYIMKNPHKSQRKHRLG